jgi:hypothetical protein
MLARRRTGFVVFLGMLAVVAHLEAVGLQQSIRIKARRIVPRSNSLQPLAINIAQKTVGMPCRVQL